jgi:hypothetical protein
MLPSVTPIIAPVWFRLIELLNSVEVEDEDGDSGGDNLRNVSLWLWY